MKIATIKKQPNERRRYGIEYSDALDLSDFIISTAVTVEPVGMTAVASSSDTFVNLLCEGGLDGVTYKITLTVTTTDANEIIEDELYVKVKEI